MNHPSGPLPRPIASPSSGDAPAPVTVNGIVHPLGAAPARRLADWLRDDLGLIGTKLGCSAGDCGACTVLVDGEQACACIVPLGQCAGGTVTTVEGLALPDGTPSALQRAFVEHGAAQCGICTPGMLMAATDLLRREPAPTEAQVLEYCAAFTHSNRFGSLKTKAVQVPETAGVFTTVL